MQLLAYAAGPKASKPGQLLASAAISRDPCSAAIEQTAPLVQHQLGARREKKRSFCAAVLVLSATVLDQRAAQHAAAQQQPPPCSLVAAFCSVGPEESDILASTRYSQHADGARGQCRSFDFRGF